MASAGALNMPSPLYAPPIVTDGVAWSVGLSVGLSLTCSAPVKNGWSDRDAVCVDDSGGPRETPVASGEYCIVFIQYNIAF